ncbi:hypothetical protein C1878_08165 [Gordonibacter sp. 28C]|uniref:hypothetical protein n=1 Tax=Gordonibacter sp. 28C TaxID=2078569 RepID=UPI000DF80D4D|nr:hypothetical protein [Gordonibacter sp. 28C]RDB62290.1 hypothetical protein C1878_08165 [Gordonibacter sp. 28C]
MLPYFKKYLFAAYALSVLIPVASLAAFSVVMGGNVVKTLPGLFSSLMLFVACLYAMPRIMGQMADRKADALVSLYNDACDPPAFLEQAEKPAGAVKTPYTEAGSWFLSFYALALADEDRAEEAARIGESMRLSAVQAQDPKVRAALLVNMEPVVLRLLGAQAALGAVEEAERLLAGAQDAESAQRRNFLAWERGVLEARLAGDDGALAEKLAHVRPQAAYPLRMRVLAAADEAAVHRRRGDVAQERECLRFVAEHGNRLPAVAAAQERLAELDA